MACSNQAGIPLSAIGSLASQGREALLEAVGVADALGNRILYWVEGEVRCCVSLNMCCCGSDGRECVCDYPKGSAGFSTQKKFIRGVCDVCHLPCFHNVTNLLFASYTKDGCSKYLYAPICGGVHFHCNR